MYTYGMLMAAFSLWVGVCCGKLPVVWKTFFRHCTFRRCLP